MKRKYWIILIILALLAIGLGLFLLFRPSVHHAEIIDPRTLHASPAHKSMIVGAWHNEGHLFYRFFEDGTGYTWDLAEDVSEKEALPFQWEAFDKAVMISHKMRLKGIVPRYYLIDVINDYDFRFHDTYNTYTLERVRDSL
jgi:hypothetical protein